MYRQGMYLGNAFSLGMLAEDAIITKETISIEKAKEVAAKCESVVGHADTAAVISSLLGIEVPANRISISLNAGDSMLVAQYIGPRLPEGATTLPEGAKIEFILIQVLPFDYIKQDYIRRLERTLMGEHLSSQMGSASMPSPAGQRTITAAARNNPDLAEKWFGYDWWTQSGGVVNTGSTNQDYVEGKVE